MTSDWLPVELPDNLLVGTSSFSWPEWTGPFYPEGTPASERIGWYATQYPAVEIDATFYKPPSRQMISNWALKTPDTFRFALKVPQDITHKMQLVGTEAATAQFLDTTALLGPRRGPLLLQFPYVARGADDEEYRHGDGFRQRLADWLEQWAAHGDWVVEIRNSTWLKPALFGLLAEYKVPLALTAYYTMPSLAAMVREELDPLTGSFAYVRFIGNHKALDKRNDELVQAGEKPPGFTELIVDRERELRGWVDSLLPVVARRRTWAFFNNHFAGFGPGSARMFARLWDQIHGG